MVWSVGLWMVCGGGALSPAAGQEPAGGGSVRELPEQIDVSESGVLFEQWQGVRGERVSDLLHSAAFARPADVRGLVDSLEFSGSAQDAFGRRMRGYLVAPKSGTMRLVVSSDDHSEVWLSPGRDPFARKRVAWVIGSGGYGWTKPGEVRFRSQQSPGFEVKQGEWYYFEAYHKEDQGEDHFALQWQFAGEETPSPIPAAALKPWTGVAEDADDDGLPDAWQERTGLAALEQGGGPWDDPDGDRLSNLEEYQAGTDPLQVESVEGHLLWEVWYGVPGPEVADLYRDLRFSGPADRAQLLPAAATPEVWTGNFGSRLSGYLVPKESGRYQLAVAGDDGTELWLSDGESSLRKERVAFGTNWRPRGHWFLPPSQQTEGLSLEAGRAYYFEVIQKDRLAPGWSALGWRREGEPEFAEVPREFLRSPGVAPEDQDGDFLPDSWTAQTLLEFSGEREGRVRFTQHGDADRDGLPNWLEAKLGTDPLAKSQVTGSWIREWWFNVPGQSVQRARELGTFLKPPSMVTLSVGPDAEQGTADWFASRLRTYVTAPVTGRYRFWIAGDDQAELWLSSTSRKFHKRRIAVVAPESWQAPETSAWTAPQAWDVRAGQASAVLELAAGETYFLEILHTDGSGDDHVSIAWSYREEGAGSWTERRPVDVDALLSYDGDEDDLDDDSLPDSWERRYGLNPEDNGSVDREKEGEAGDFDGDGLTNHEEFLLGTDPTKADTDGDGVGDYDELHLYGTDPLRKDAAPPVLHAAAPLPEHGAAPGTWFLMPDGTIRSSTLRGKADFVLELDEPGIYLLELQAKAYGTGAYVLPIPVIAGIDGRETGRGEVTDEGTVHRWLTPWLEAGSHTITVENRNVRNGQSLGISSLTLWRHEGEDADGNAIPDWLEPLFRKRNRMDSWPAGSAVSPLCLEGSWRFPGDAFLEAPSGVIPATAGTAGRWFANVPLAPAGTTVVTARFENGALAEEQELVWTATNVFEVPSLLSLRVGDSLKLAGGPPGAEAATVRYTLDGEDLGEFPAAAERVATFGNPGRFELQATVQEEAGPLTATVTVEVLQAEFGPEPDLAAGHSRVWDLPGVPHAAVLESDAGLVLTEEDRGVESPRRFTLLYEEAGAGSPRVVARLWEGGPVLAATTVHVFRLVSASDSDDIATIQVLPDGTRVVEVGYLIDGPVPADLSLWLELFVTDAVFEDGSTRYRLTAADFDENGVARLRIYKAPGSTVPFVCHWLRPYAEE